MPDSISFRVTRGRPRGREFTFRDEVSLVIGRQGDCGLILPDEKISRRHCRLDVDPPFVFIRDLGSLNGTYLNGARLGGRVLLRDGDRLGIGRNCELTLSSSLRDDGAAEMIAGYDLIELVGRGARGGVWRVREKAGGRQFALKLTAMRGLPEAGERKKFLREAALAEQLDHPNIVRQFKSGESGDWFYILQELCEGGSVGNFMERRGGRALPLETATHIISQVLKALIYAHRTPLAKREGEEKRKGLVHRDICPGNIFLMDDTERPAAKVGDFGLSKIYEMSGWTDPTRPGEFAGALEFTPKEQILHYKNAGPQVDVWAAAATYYCLLTGRPPKGILPAGDQLGQALILKARPIRELNPGISVKLARVIDAALKEEPEIGCRDAAEFKERIEAALKEGPKSGGRKTTGSEEKNGDAR